MERKALDDLLGNDEPCASFHDAYLERVSADYLDRKLVMEFDLSIGDPDGSTEEERQRYRKGTLELGGLVFWGIDPPQEEDFSRYAGPLWVVSDGFLEDAKTETARTPMKRLKNPSLNAWYLYLSDMNTFAYIVAEAAVFQWKAA